MNWQDVQKLRRAGQLKEAHEAALGILAADPADFRTKSQYEWVIFKYIKLIVANIAAALDKNRPIASRDVDKMMDWMRKYYRLQPRIPDMACSNILSQLVKVGIAPSQSPRLHRLDRN